MSGILAVLEAGQKISLETLAAARDLGAKLQLPVHVVEPDRNYTADDYTDSLAQLIREKSFDLILFPHTYQVRDFAPKLATRFDRALISDVIRLRVEGAKLFATRQLFQGKLNAELEPIGKPIFLSLQAGAYAPAEAQAPTETLPAAGTSRQKPEERYREAQRAVDLSAAPIIVSVGRGIKEKENLSLIEDLAAVLGAEIAASRPICDNGWLPMERQVGSSGQTVTPKLYLAIGLSGAIQHLVGMKGSKTIVAINKDPNAPIFEVADYGICDDLFDVVPALTAAIKAAKS
ncbi:electron transfer flavoprotein subunit alpha/FixB family protein [Bryobacter aggregatus]|uniref:electron transfer flavoprotein subunit alpha/FixB family protein n=1 Tax=Bryobacter aggregatus TaxID=360054 RepID=UPI0004E1A9E8|nr:electron transfer flavoprotein subunit alpha/FixB family protein [Bryobacter aggregatus]